MKKITKKLDAVLEFEIETVILEKFKRIAKARGISLNDLMRIVFMEAVARSKTKTPPRTRKQLVII